MSEQQQQPGSQPPGSQSTGPRPGQRLIGADELADTLGLHRPTPQQKAVIESTPGPALVIAGAGSGKTETMASRVLWLLANRYVAPGEILGLTFTRKAAGELAERIRQRIAQLADAGLLAEDYDAFDAPVVATYNSFANTIFRDNAILIGREADGTVLGEASAWQLARSIVIASTDERLIALEKNVDSITRAVLSLSHELSENVVAASSVHELAGRFAALGELPPGGRGEYAEALGLVSSVGALPVLLDLAEQFAAAKARNGFVEYSDQVALALQIVRGVPRVREEFRERFGVVLLDEYQDTSVVQTWLLSELFSGRPVMAVGDPNQSIYGWRGASAANLEQFSAQFSEGADGGGPPAAEFALATSWRNGHDILSVANALVEPLRAGTSVHVERLQASPTASALPIDVVYEETLAEEAMAAARWLEERLGARPDARHNAGSGQKGGKGTPPSAAMLFRARKTQTAFIEALRERGIPYHVLGIGGLLGEPEIADLVCALTVVNDPTAGSELVRLLAGSRWRIGARDLHALSRVASWLRDRDFAQQPLDDELKQKMRASVADGEGGSIVDALDFVAHARWAGPGAGGASASSGAASEGTASGDTASGSAAPGSLAQSHGILQGFSDIGLARLREAGLVFARLRARAGLGLLDFVTLVEQEFQLDIEVAANERRPLGRANLEAFFDALNGYLAVNEAAGLGGFLGWLREAEWRDGLAPRPEDPEPGTVQLLTIHGSKGLEWDLVVVPRCVDGELPGTGREGSNGWLSFGTLPYEFRGDAAELPVFAWEGAESRKDLLDRRGAFKEAVKARHEREERRLAYVAVTRARHSLLLSGSFWATQTKPRVPSPFLRELAEANVIGPLPEGSAYEERPEDSGVNTLSWPIDPLGGRRERVERAAELVREASPAAGGVWGRELELLLEERERALRANELVPLPSRVPASRFKDFVTEPAVVAAALRRPMPEKPYRASRLGTLFHGWVEDRYGLSGSREVIDALSDELESEEPAVDQEELARLQAIFEHSPWAELRPVEVERELHLPFDGRVVICKIDAVYEQGGRYQIVDWKTGKAPKDAAELAERQLQLALYRLAFARWKGIAPEEIDAVFYYVSDDRVIAPDRIYDEAELLTLWRAATGPQ